MSLCRLGFIMNHSGWKFRFAPEIVVKTLTIKFQKNMFSSLWDTYCCMGYIMLYGIHIYTRHIVDLCSWKLEFQDKFEWKSAVFNIRDLSVV